MVFVSYASEITILNTTFVDNVADIVLSPYAKPGQPNVISISGCTFEGNTSPTKLSLPPTGTASVTNSFFRQNVNQLSITVNGGKRVTVRNCTFFGNTACTGVFCGALVFNSQARSPLDVDVSCNWFEANTFQADYSSCIGLFGSSTALVTDMLCE